MATVTLVEGYEHGVFSTQGGGIASASTGTTPAIESTIVKSGSYSLKFVAASATSAYTRPINGTTSAAYCVGHFDIYVASKSGNQSELIHAYGGTGSQVGLSIKNGTTGFYLQACIGTTYTGNQSVELAFNTWHCVDFCLDISSATVKVDFRVNNSAVTQSTWSGTSGSFPNLHVGTCDTTTATFYIDNLVLSQTLADYPFKTSGCVEVEKQIPVSGTASSNPGTVIEDNSGTDINDSTNPAYQYLDDVPLSGGTDYIQQSGTGTGNYAEALLGDTSQTSILGVSGWLAYTSSGTSANNGQTRVRDSGGQESTIYSGDMSESSRFYKTARVLNPSGGWSQSEVNALTVRVGYSNDANPLPRWQAFLIQVAYLPSAATPISISDSGSGSDSIAGLKNSLSLSDSGAGSDAVNTPYRLKVMSDAGTGADTPKVEADVTISDSFAGADAISVSVKAYKDIQDSGSGADAIAGQGRRMSDAGSGSDAVSVWMTFKAISLSETGSGVDSIYGQGRRLSDSGSGIETIALREMGRIVSDSGSGADSVATAQKAYITQSDTGYGVDSIYGMGRRISDSGGLTGETVTTKHYLSISETGSGIDAITVFATLKYVAVSDSGAGADAVAQVKARVALTDLGAGSDVPAVRVIQPTLHESGTGSDAVSSMESSNYKQVSDSGSGSDSVKAIAPVLIHEAMVGVDSIPLLAMGTYDFEVRARRHQAEEPSTRDIDFEVRAGRNQAEGPSTRDAEFDMPRRRNR